MCAWDAYDSFGARDGDAAWAYVGAGAAFTGVTVATIFAGASWAGPLGWICAGIGLGLMYLAYVLTDSPLEKYFKHFIFSDLKAFPKESGLITWQFNKQFYDARQSFMGKDNDMSFLVDCTRAAAELNDLLVCSQISFTAQKLIREETRTVMISQKMSQTISIGYTTTLLVSVNFNQFLSRSEQFFSEVYFFENGIEAGNPRFLSGIQNTIIVEGTDEQPPKIEQQLQIPSFLAHRANPSSCILFYVN